MAAQPDRSGRPDPSSRGMRISLLPSAATMVQFF
jgi:hypothetical protein